MDAPHRGRSQAGTLVLVAALTATLAVALFQVPLATVFTVGILLICPLMMLGMHRSHGGHDSHDASEDTPERRAHEHPAGR